jgi:tetratricopeptide (TPR) repeat protein
MDKTTLDMRSLRAWLFVGLALGICGRSQAQDVPGYPPLNPHTLLQGPYDSRELALLPRYCYHTQIFRQIAPGGNNKQEIDAWYAALGDTYHHLHHYCWGMMKTNRAVLLARDRRVREFFLHDALGEYEYVIQRAPSDFVLLPEILTKRAENLLLLGKAPLGILDLERAIELKPDYWPAHAKLADHYKSTGEVQKARAQLEAGLKAAPGTSALTRRLAELGAPEARTK